MKIQVKNLKNEDVREIDLDEAIFDYPYKEHLIHTAIRAVRAAWRSGTHKVKERGEVRGSNRKPWRQKGTGRARAGTIRSPLWKGGGTVHGPRPRSYEMKVSTREKRNALKSALSRKLADEGIIIVDSLELDSHKTKDLAQALAGLGIEKKVLVVDFLDNRNLGLAARNNPHLKTVDATGVNVYDVVDRDHILISESALERLLEVLSK